MRRTSLLDRDEEETAIDLSSMIDCIFILLIFFIVTTVFVEEKGFQVAKPDAAAAATAEESENLIFEINAQNRVAHDGQEISVADIAAKVRAGMKDETTPVMIRVHEKADHGFFVEVWDAARSAGAETLTFNTVQ